MQRNLYEGCFELNKVKWWLKIKWKLYRILGKILVSQTDLFSYWLMNINQFGLTFFLNILLSNWLEELSKVSQ